MHRTCFKIRYIIPVILVMLPSISTFLMLILELDQTTFMITGGFCIAYESSLKKAKLRMLRVDSKTHSERVNSE